MSVTLQEVARRAGVSISTASIAFSGAGPIAPQTRERVLAAAADLGYQGPNPMAASLRTGRSGVIGVVIDGDLRHSFRDPVAVQVLDGISGALGEAGYGVLLIPRRSPDGAPHPLLATAAMDAAILFYGLTPQDETVAALHRRKIPMVAMNGSAAGVTLVNVAERHGMRLVGEHLLRAGHRRVALATLPYAPTRRSGWVAAGRTPVHTVTAERLAGIEEAGLEPVAVWECRGSRVDEGIEAGAALLNLSPRPTALVGFSDLIAAGLVLAAQEASLTIPDDVAVAGFDGVDLPWLSGHKLTTVDQPRTERGAIAAAAAVTLADGGTPPGQTLAVTLVTGTTT